MTTQYESFTALAEPGERPAALAALATSAGVDAVFIFVPHPDAPQKLVPAPGAMHTLPSQRGWRDLLARCTEPGVYDADVAYPDACGTAPAVALAYTGLTVVFVGGTPVVEISETLTALAPLLAAMLRAEANVVTARADLEVERESAQRAELLARALEIARAEAVRATRVKDEFLAMLGHELRNPLAPIVTALQMMRMEGMHTRAQEVLERQVSHVMRLVDDLLDVSRITRGKIELRREPVEIASVVTRALEMARPLLESRRSAVDVHVPQGLVVDGDPARLAQVVSNIVTNAAKYSDPGTEIRVSAARREGTISIVVADRGIGIEPSQLDAVFEQFVQMPQGLDRAEGGLGLGLAIVKSFVHAHGGHVRAHSEGIGRGSTFEIELPASDATPVTATTPSVPAPRSSSKLEVLIVDDNDDAAELLAEILEAYGHAVRVAHSGPEALRLLDTFTPRAAILDIGLPVMDGYELCRRIRARFPETSLIAVTGYGQSSDRAKTAEAGFDEHLVKPVSIASVTTALERLCR